MKYYFRGLAFGTLLIAIALLISGVIRPFASTDTLKSVPPIIFISGFSLFGFFYKWRHGSFWPIPNKNAKDRVIRFLLGAGTAISSGICMMAAAEHPVSHGWFLWIFIVAVLSLVIAPFFSLNIAALIFFGGLFCRDKNEHEPDIKFEVVASGRPTTQLEILKARLNAEGIPAFMLNGGMNQMLPLGGAGLEVPENYAKEARDIIAAIDSGELTSVDAQEG